MRYPRWCTLAAIAVATWPVVATAQDTATLPSDAEHYGATFDKLRPVTFYTSGHLAGGVLKYDYGVNGLIFEAASTITFYEDGRVKDGMLKVDGVVGGRTFLKGPISFYATGAVASGILAAGYTDSNLVLPLNSIVGLDADGRIGGFTPVVNVPKYAFMGRSLRSTATTQFDRVAGVYRLVAGRVAEPTLVARFVTKRNRLGMPVSQIPLVVPPDTNFRLNMTDPTATGGNQVSDIWSLPSRFIFNGWDFGSNPAFLRIRDMRLSGVAVSTAVTVGGLQFPAGSVIQFDDNGRIIPPSELEPFP